MTIDGDYVAQVIAKRIAGDIVYSEDYGQALRKWREYFGVSQNEVAREMGVSTSVISDYEKGRRSPGAGFIKKFVTALLRIDERRGWRTVSQLAQVLGIPPGAVLDMAEFNAPVTVGDLASAVEGVVLAGKDNAKRIYGYTVVDSIKAILTLSGIQFMALFGSNPQRAIVFTASQTGRSPMVAVRASPIKPAAVVLHGPGRNVDKLAVEIARRDGVSLIVSLLDSVDDLVARLRSLAARSPTLHGV